MQKNFKITFQGKDYPCFYIDDRTEAEVVIKQLASKKTILAADLETAALPKFKHIKTAALSPHLGEPRLIQMFTGTGAVVIDLYKTGKIDLKTIFNSRPSVFHNCTFDYKMLNNHYGLIEPDMHCTAIMARCVFHAIFPDKVAANLEMVTRVLFKEKVIKKAGKSDWSIPELTFEQIEYAAKDAVLQMKVYEKLNEYIDKLNLRKVYELYRKAQLVISRMELNGINIDVEAHRKNIIKWRQELVDARDEIHAVTDLGIITDSKIGDWLERTVDEETLSLWPRSEKTNKLSVDANTLIYFDHVDVVKPFSEFQKFKKLTTTYGTNLLEQINPSTNRIHSGYFVAGAKSGRLSSSNPNKQNMPREYAMRAIFIPTDGYVMLVSDYSQVEVRAQAEISGDERMLKAFEDGLDIYTYTVAMLNNKPMNQVTKEERQKGKCLILGLAYGLGVKKFAHYAKKNYKVNVSLSESFDLINGFRELFPTFREWQLDQVNGCPGKRYMASTLMGKKAKFTDTTYYGACLNLPIQGTCAEIMLMALVMVEEKLKGTSGRLLATVHDEILLECLPKDVVNVNNILTNEMQRAYNSIFTSGRTMNGLVDPTAGINWADAKMTDKEKKEMASKPKVEKVYKMCENFL